MTIGVPICRDTELCREAAARLAQHNPAAEVVVALDEDGMAAGWLAREQLLQAGDSHTVGEVMNEDIPTVQPDIPAEAAAHIMRDRGVNYLFLMHDWPGEPRPSAVISLQDVERRLK